MDCEGDGWVSLSANGRCRQHQSHCSVAEMSWMDHYEQACEMVAEPPCNLRDPTVVYQLRMLRQGIKRNAIAEGVHVSGRHVFVTRTEIDFLR